MNISLYIFAYLLSIVFLMVITDKQLTKYLYCVSYISAHFKWFLRLNINFQTIFRPDNYFILLCPFWQWFLWFALRPCVFESTELTVNFSSYYFVQRDETMMLVWRGKNEDKQLIANVLSGWEWNNGRRRKGNVTNDKMKHDLSWVLLMLLLLQTRGPHFPQKKKRWREREREREWMCVFVYVNERYCVFICVWVCVYVCVCLRDREIVCVREIERKKYYVCVWGRDCVACVYVCDREIMCFIVNVCMCDIHREIVCLWQRKRERERGEIFFVYECVYDREREPKTMIIMRSLGCDLRE